MASKFKVTPATVRNKASELENLNNQFKNEVSGLRDDNTALGSKWEGDARNAFNNEFLKDAEKFDLFYQGIQKFIEQLRQDCDNYDKVEANNTNIASTRNS